MDVAAGRDADWVEAAANGSEDAFGEIVRAYQGRVRAYLCRCIPDRHVADDLAQETFLAAYRTLSTFNRANPLDLWLLGIARNRALKYLRNEGRRRKHLDYTLESVIADWCADRIDADPEDPVEGGRQLDALESCLRRLPEHSSSMIAAFYLNGQSSIEIARSRGQKESAVRMALLRVRQALRDCIRTKLSAQGAGV